MTNHKEDIPGTKSNPVDNSARGQSELKAKESGTSRQPGSVQSAPQRETAEESRNGRQEPDADGATSLTDSEETTEAILNSPQAHTRHGRTAVGKSGQGAARNKSDPVKVVSFDNYKDISPKKNTGKPPSET
jgi:hypothetical protein